MSSSKDTKGLKGLKGQRCSNTNVSMPALSKRDTFLISGLKVDPKHPSSHRNAKAVCWNYFGSIKFCTPDDSEFILDKSRYYRSLILSSVQQKARLAEFQILVAFHCKLHPGV